MAADSFLDDPYAGEPGVGEEGEECVPPSRCSVLLLEEGDEIGPPTVPTC